MPNTEHVVQEPSSGPKILLGNVRVGSLVHFELHRTDSNITNKGYMLALNFPLGSPEAETLTPVTACLSDAARRKPRRVQLRSTTYRRQCTSGPKPPWRAMTSRRQHIAQSSPVFTPSGLETPPPSRILIATNLEEPRSLDDIHLYTASSQIRARSRSISRRGLGPRDAPATR